MMVFVVVGIAANLIGGVMFVHSGLKDKVLSIVIFFGSKEVMVLGSRGEWQWLRTCLD